MAGFAVIPNMAERLSGESAGHDHSTYWLFGVLFFGVGDLTTTAVGLGTGNVTERNVVPALLIDRHGIVALFGLKLLAFGVCYAFWRVADRPSRLGIPLGLALLGVFVTGWNLRVLFAAVGP